MDRFGFKLRWVVQAVPLLVLCGLLIYYFGSFAPGKAKSLSQRNLRALARQADHLRLSIESFPKALEIAAKSQERPTSTNTNVLSHGVREAMTLVPRLQLAKAPEVRFTPVQTSDFSFQTTNVLGRSWLNIRREGPAGTNTNLTVTLHARCDLEAFLRDAPGFDGLVLARSDGTVIVDSLPAGWRLLRLDALRGAANEPVASNLLAGASQNLEIHLGAEPYRLFSQPLQLGVRIQDEASAEWLLCGLVRSDRIENQARALPHVYWTWGLYLALVALLSGPFCKFFFADARERLTCWNVRWLVINSVALLALLSLALASLTTYVKWEEQAGDDLDEFGGVLATNLQDELQALHEQLIRFDVAARQTNTSPSLIVVNLLTNLDLVPASGLVHPHFHTISWLNDRGLQVQKWTTRRISTPLMDLKERNYFRDAIEERASDYAWQENSDRFWVEPIYAYYSGENSVVVSIRTTNNIVPAGDDGRPAIGVLTVDAPLISVAAPVLPPGIGFCVVAMDGRVLLHSERQRSLRENFFEECDWDERLVRLTAARAQGHIEDIDYLGRVHSFNVRPLAHQSWSLIVFRDEGPLSAFNFQITIVSLVLLAGWLLAAGAMALLAWGLLALLKTMGVKPPWASLPDPMRPILGMLRPDHDGRPAYIALTLANLAVVVGTLIWVLTTDSTVSMAAAAICGAVLGLSGVCFGLATSRGLAVATSVGNVIREVIRMARGGATSLHARAVAAPHGYGRTLTSVLLLLSVIPAIACQRIAHQLGARHYLKHSLRQVASALQARDEQVTAGYRDYKLPAGFLADRLNLASPPGGTRNWDVYTGHFFSTRAEPGATLEAPAGPDLFDDVFSLMGSDRDAPMLLLTEAHDRSWRFEQSGPGRRGRAPGQVRLTAEITTLVNDGEPWQVLLGAVGLMLA
jgi:hypothetical protein